MTFLYQLAPGSSPRSYGINVARLAQLPPEVIALAMRQSAEFEASFLQQGKGQGQGQDATAMDVDGADASSAGAAGAGAAGVSSLAASAARSPLAPFFERLVSLADSTVPTAELAAAARELWRRLAVAREAEGL